MIFGIGMYKVSQPHAECADLVGSEGADISFQFLYGL